MLADQQNKQSGSYQQGKQNTDDERNNPMPTGLDVFRPSAFLRCSQAQPEEKFVHSSERRHRRGFVGAILCLRLRLSLLGSAKSRNPARKRRDPRQLDLEEALAASAADTEKDAPQH